MLDIDVSKVGSAQAWEKELGKPSSANQNFWEITEQSKIKIRTRASSEAGLKYLHYT
jgi:hypothetical protein